MTVLFSSFLSTLEVDNRLEMLNRSAKQSSIETKEWQAGCIHLSYLWEQEHERRHPLFDKEEEVSQEETQQQQPSSVKYSQALCV